jgi:hypothetical protein
MLRRIIIHFALHLRVQRRSSKDTWLSHLLDFKHVHFLPQDYLPEITEGEHHQVSQFVSLLEDTAFNTCCKITLIILLKNI